MQGQYADLSNYCFIGKVITLLCNTQLKEPSLANRDFVKVKVSHIIGNDSPRTTELVGVILKESSFSDDYRLGDLIAFRKEEIVNVDNEGNC